MNSAISSELESIEVRAPREAVRALAGLSPSVLGYVVMLGATSIILGVHWDISWHRTIGRDSFWTPAHMAIYLGGVLGGLMGAYLILRCSFGAGADREARTVRILGLRGPLGAWVCAWGALAMLTSAPFDNWWHDAYGLDVKILSPPHTILALGMFGIVIGALLLVLREQNLALDAGHGDPRRGTRLLLYGGGVMLAMVAVFLTEESWPNQQRNKAFYLVSCATYPMYLLAVARASRSRWGATTAAAWYMAICVVMLWLLPLFPGEPKLGPIYNPIDRFVPLPFPLLLVVPALGVDLLRRAVGEGRGGWRDWALALSCGFAFAVLFIGAQWGFSAFLISPGAENAIFGADRYWSYNEAVGDGRYRFWSETSPRWNPPATAASLLLAVTFSLVASRVGVWLGNGMARVRR